MRTRFLFVGGPLLAAGVAAGIVLALARGSREGRWTWILPPERFADYEAGRCPQG